MKYFILFSAVSLLVMVFCVLYTIHVAIQFQRFNDGIKAWAENLDNSTNAAIQRASRQILKELDEKITEQQALERQELENEEDV